MDTILKISFKHPAPIGVGYKTIIIMPTYRINTWEGTAKAVQAIEKLLRDVNPNNKVRGIFKFLQTTKGVEFSWEELLNMSKLYLPYEAVVAGTNTSGQFYQQNSNTDWWLRTAERQGVFELIYGRGEEVVYLMGEPGNG